jgi:hypothetical protein
MQHCDVKIDDFIHGTRIISQSLWYNQTDYDTIGPRVDHSKAFCASRVAGGYFPLRAELKPPFNYLNFKNGPFVCTHPLLILSKSLKFFVLYIPFK